MKSIEWTTARGNLITITIDTITSQSRNLDGQEIAVACCKLDVVARLNGKLVGMMEPNRTGLGDPNYAAFLAVGGPPLAIDSAHYDMVMAAIAEEKTMPAWIAKTKKENDNLDGVAAYEISKREMEKRNDWN